MSNLILMMRFVDGYDGDSRLISAWTEKYASPPDMVADFNRNWRSLPRVMNLFETHELGIILFANLEEFKSHLTFCDQKIYLYYSNIHLRWYMNHG